MNRRLLSVLVLVFVTATTLQAQRRADTATAATPRAVKSPTTAGILSGAGAYVGVAGLGSFYAGNRGHGVRHLAIGLLTAAVAVSGVVTCADLDCRDSEGLLMVGGALAYTANAVWSVFVAVADAHAYNRRADRPRAPDPPLAAGLQPSMWNVSCPSGCVRPRRLVLRLARVEF